MAKPFHGGDKSLAHKLNVERIEDYIARLKAEELGLPESPSWQGEISWVLVAEESGVDHGLLVRSTSQLRKMILSSGLELELRLKPRIRSVYTLEEATNIAVAVIQADCEKERTEHQLICARVSDLLKRIAQGCELGKLDDSILAISAALEQRRFAPAEAKLLERVNEILLRATKGELELNTFHGRLKLEAALAGISISALSKFTKAKAGTVIHWAEGVKAPTASYVSEIGKMEAVLGLEAEYLEEVYLSNRSGGSSIQSRFLPKEVLSMSVDRQAAFRRLFMEGTDLAILTDEERGKLMAEKLAIFYEDRDTVDHKRAKLRFGEMVYGLKDLPEHLKEEYADLVMTRTSVIVRDGVRSQWRGWDGDTTEIYHRKLCLFFGWLHHHMGVPLENLSIAYFAFSAVLHEYDFFLLDRKKEVGIDRRWVEADRGWYIFAGSLTRRGTDGASIENDDNFDDFKPQNKGTEDTGGTGAGWLRRRKALLSKIVPIDRIRLSGRESDDGGDEDTAMPVLAAGTIEKAKREWARMLDLTTRRYQSLRKPLKREAAKPDSVGRIVPILRFENPLDAIEIGAMKLRETAEGLREGSYNWCTAIRDAVTLKMHAQLPLRRKTFCGLTYNYHNTGMVFQERGKWVVRIPASLFKNEKSEAFQQYVENGYYTAFLRDDMRLYEDMAIYVELAREGILSGQKSTAFYVNRGRKQHVTPDTFAGRFRTITRDYIAENRGRKTGLQGVKSFGSHAMRHIVASAVFWKTGNIAEAAAAIHDSEKMTEKHYKHLFVSPQRRAQMLGPVFESTAMVKLWRPFKRTLPLVRSPSVVSEISDEGVSAAGFMDWLARCQEANRTEET